MVVFHEFFPVKKESIAAYVNKQENVESLVKDTHGYESSAHPVKDVFDVPKKQSLSNVIQGLIDDNNNDLRVSEVMEKKMNELHKMIENFDKINYFMDPPQSEKIFDHKRVDIAQSESILSLGKRDMQQPVDESSCASIVKQPSTIKKSIKLFPKNSQLSASSSQARKKQHEKIPSMSEASLPHKVMFAKAERDSTIRSVKKSSILRIPSEASSKQHKSQVKIPIAVVNHKFK